MFCEERNHRSFRSSVVYQHIVHNVDCWLSTLHATLLIMKLGPIKIVLNLQFGLLYMLPQVGWVIEWLYKSAQKVGNILQHSCTFCSSIFSKINFINLLLLCTVMLYFFKGRKSHLYSLAGFFSKRIIKRNKKDQYEKEHKTKRCHDTIIYTHSQHNLIFYTCIWAHNHDV